MDTEEVVAKEIPVWKIQKGEVYRTGLKNWDGPDFPAGNEVIVVAKRDYDKLFIENYELQTEIALLKMKDKPKLVIT